MMCTRCTWNVLTPGIGKPGSRLSLSAHLTESFVYTPTAFLAPHLAFLQCFYPHRAHCRLPSDLFIVSSEECEPQEGRHFCLITGETPNHHNIGRMNERAFADYPVAAPRLRGEGWGAVGNAGVGHGREWEVICHSTPASGDKQPQRKSKLPTSAHLPRLPRLHTFTGK